MARFIVDTGDLKMTEEAEAALANEIQTVALRSIARADIRERIAIKFPIPFPGIILRPDFGQLDKIEEQLGGALRGV